MKKLLFVVAMVLVVFALPSHHVNAFSQCCVTACGTTHAHGSSSGASSCLNAETQAFNNANPGCSICWQGTVTEHCTKTGTTWSGTADYDFICLTPCGIC